MKRSEILKIKSTQNLKLSSKWFIWKRGKKTLTRNFNKILPMLLIISFSIGALSMLYDLVDNLNYVADYSLEKTAFPDGIITFATVPEPVADLVIMNSLEDYFHIYENRLVVPVSMNINGIEEKGLIVGINISARQYFNKLIDGNGNSIKNYNGSMEYRYCYKFGVKLGDEVSISYGNWSQTQKIQEIGYNPEWAFMSLVKGVIFPSRRPIPVIYYDLDYVQENIIHAEVVNQLVYKLNENTTQAEFETKIQRYMNSIIQNYMPREQLPYLRNYETRLRSNEHLYSLAIIFLSAVAIVVTIALFHRLLDDDYKNISVYRALGATNKEIFNSYMVFLGFLLLSTLPFSLFVQQAMSYSVDIINRKMLMVPFNTNLGTNIWLIIPFTMMIGFFCFITGIISLRKLDTEEIKDSMRHSLKFLNKKNRIESAFDKILKKYHHKRNEGKSVKSSSRTCSGLSPLGKYNIRQIFGRKTFFVMMILMLSMSISLLVLLYSFNDSYHYSTNHKMETTENWDLTIQTWNYENASVIDKSMKGLENISGYELGVVDIVQFSVDLQEKYNFFLFAYEENSTLHRLPITKGRELRNPRECIVSLDVLQKYNVSLGDQIFIESLHRVFAYQFTIVGVINDFTERTVVTNLPDAGEILDKKQLYNIIYVNVTKGVDIQGITSVIESESVFSYTQPLTALKLMLDDFNDSFELIISVFAISLFSIAFIIIFFLIQNLISYRINDYSILKSIGISDREILSSIIIEVIIYLLCSLLIGFLIGNLVSNYIINDYAKTIPGIIFNIYPRSYLIMTIEVIIILILGAIKPLRKLRNMNIAEYTTMRNFS